MAITYDVEGKDTTGPENTSNRIKPTYPYLVLFQKIPHLGNGKRLLCSVQRTVLPKIAINRGGLVSHGSHDMPVSQRGFATATMVLLVCYLTCYLASAARGRFGRRKYFPECCPPRTLSVSFLINDGAPFQGVMMLTHLHRVYGSSYLGKDDNCIQLVTPKPSG